MVAFLSSFASSRRTGTAFLPLSSFANYLDLKLGSEIITFLLLLNKVAGVYGLLAVFFGGTLAQVSMYLYSVASIAVALWGLRVIGEENPAKVLLYSHLYTIDHLISSLYTLYFTIYWYKYTPHDGRRVANSAAQKEILNDHDGIGLNDSDAERARKAQAVWQDERAFSAVVLLMGWFVKIYFITILYSFSMHLRRGTWRTLLASQLAYKQSSNRRTAAGTAAGNGYSYSHIRNTSTASTTVGAVHNTVGGELVWDDEHDDADFNFDDDERRAREMGDDELDRQIRELEGGPASSTSAGSGSGTARKGSEAGTGSGKLGGRRFSER